MCDMYLEGFYGGRSSFVLGRAEFMPEENGSSVIFSVQTYAAKKEKILAAWEMFAKGKAKEVCPE